MKTTLPRLVSILAIVIAAGCKTPTQTVRIESVPPGARIFLGTGYVPDVARESRGFIGVAPCETTVRTDGRGGWQIDGVFLMSMAVSPTAVFSAELDGQTREQVFHSGALGRPADKVPAAILFDFTKPQGPATPAR